MDYPFSEHADSAQPRIPTLYTRPSLPLGGGVWSRDYLVPRPSRVGGGVWARDCACATAKKARGAILRCYSASPFSRYEIAMASKTVLLKYEEHRKKVMIPAEKDTSDLAFLESSFRQAFNFEKQVNLTISFQRYDADFDELVDMEDGDEIQHLEKLNVVVTSVLVTPSAVSQYTVDAQKIR